jgi:hypothetical protein
MTGFRDDFAPQNSSVTQLQLDNDLDSLGNVRSTGVAEFRDTNQLSALAGELNKGQANASSGGRLSTDFSWEEANQVGGSHLHDLDAFMKKFLDDEVLGFCEGLETNDGAGIRRHEDHNSSPTVPISSVDHTQSAG